MANQLAKGGMTMERRWLYQFHEVDEAEHAVGGEWSRVRALLGGKGANLGEMTRLGIPVPPGFTITTAACLRYLDVGEQLPEGLWDEVSDAIRALEREMGLRFGDPERPLLVSCRSGAKFSMPGMMDTVLNIGLNDEIVDALARQNGDPRFVLDLYRRLIQMFGHVVLDVPDERFEAILSAARARAGVAGDGELAPDDWRAVIDAFKREIEAHSGAPFPQAAREQLRLAIEAVFRSWNGRRARDYRRAAGIPDDLGTAVNIQTMVFGNRGEGSGTGVLFTRNPVDGTDELYGDYLMNAQGEDVVAGIRRTHPIANLAVEMPLIFAELGETVRRLERHFRDVQDIEFTIENGRLWILQTRDGKRTARAAIRLAVELALEGVISRDEALRRVSPEQVDALLHPRFDEATLRGAADEGRRLGHGVNASPGAAVGVAVFDADTAEAWGKEGRAVIMIRPETRPDDVHGMLASAGILTSHGGNASHAAIVARQFGVPAVVGCAALEIEPEARRMVVAGQTIREGDPISLDGTSGEIYVGLLPTIEASFDDPWLRTLLTWADDVRRMDVRANADTPADAARAREFGAEGIGLCRTEHMFLSEERLPVVRRMIMAADEAEREAALAELLPMQREDFHALFHTMNGLPVIIRLIDPPLHEFLPEFEPLVAEAARLEGRREFTPLTDVEQATLDEDQRLLAAERRLREANPMLGLRGVRLGVAQPGVMEMQVRAIFEAASQATREGVEVRLEVMIPLVSHVNELRVEREALEEVAQQVMADEGVHLSYRFGTMIELPRAALTADRLAEVAEFFSFGTNDLTQTTFGISRDDAEAEFLITYLEKKILPENPFQTIDVEGVGELMRIATELGRARRPAIELGICGEHGGDPASIRFCHELELDYVSCSPFRVPVARLAAAQAVLEEEAARLALPV